MKTSLISCAIAALLLAACGGGSSDGGNNGGTAPATFVLATPKVGAENTFSEISVSNQNNSWNQGLVSQVTAVNADGSFVQQSYDPSGNTITSGGIDYTIYPGTYYFNSSAQETSQTIAYSSTDTQVCDFSPNSGSAPSTLTVGQTWSASYTACANDPSPISYSLTGTLVDVETLTVPAGTFNTFKFQNTLTYTRPSGLVVTENTTTWRNADPTDSRAIQQVSNYSYSGITPPDGIIASRTRVLQSYK